MENTKSIAFPRNHRHFNHNFIFCYNNCSCLIFRELSLFKTVSLKMFSGTTICDNWNCLLMGPWYSEIQAQCTSTAKLLSKLSGQGSLQLCFWNRLSEPDYPIHHLPAGRWPSQPTLHRLCYQQTKMPVTIMWRPWGSFRKVFSNRA